MPVNNRTTSRNYAKPNVANLLSEDVVRLSEALDSIDTDVAALQSKAPLASPALTGTPSAPTPAVDTNTTQVATTAFVVGQASAANPIINGTATAGGSSRYSRADHVHPTDTTRAPVASPTFTGAPAAPTAAADTDTTQLATTAYVIGQNYTKQTRTVFAGAGLTGGGDLTANRTIAADLATQAEAEAGASSAKLMTPQRVAQAIAVLVAPEEYGTITAETFATSGTFTKHADDLSYIVHCVAGGGGGGKRGTSTGGTIGGGGGGAGNWQHIPAAIVGATETVTVGSGGSGATASTGGRGSAGGASSFGNLVPAYGGSGGRSAGSSGGGGGGVLGTDAFASPGAGGDKTTSLYGGGAGLGGDNATSTLPALYGGGGGSSTNRTSILAGDGGVDGATGATPGGGGGASTNTTTGNGGNGAPGRVTVYRIKRK